MEYAKAVRALCDAQVEFILIGGVAASLHGSSNVTFDLDICFSRKPENLRRLASALASFHPRPQGLPPDLPFIRDEATLRNGTIFTLETSLGNIDLLAEVAGVGAYEEAKARSIELIAFDRRLSMLDLPSLIASKRAAGRPKDLLVLPELESLAEAEEPE
jgi:hypothetical protein